MSNDQVRIEYVPLTALKKAPRNPKTHDIGELDKSIERFGFVQPITLDDRTGQLVAGHGRLETLVKIKAEGRKPPKRISVAPDGEWLVPVIRGVSFNNEQEAEAYIIADNRLVEIGGWDEAELATMLKGFSEVLDGTAGLGFAEADLARITASLDSQIAGTPAEEWSGMPEFDSTDTRPFRQIIVSFLDEEGVADFQSKIGQVFSDTTRSVQHPKRVTQSMSDHVWVSGEAQAK